MQNRITEKQPLLDDNGNIINPGYAKTPLYEYNRDNINSSSLFIKEWDYYYVANDSFALCLTISDMGYIGALSASFIDFKSRDSITHTATSLFPMGGFKMPQSSEYGVSSKTIGSSAFNFDVRDGVRTLKGKYAKFGKDKEDLLFNIILSDQPKESMTIATPFGKDGKFYLNRKINCMRASGMFSIGSKEYAFEDGALGTLDWGRGVWTYDNTWYWSSLQTTVDGERFGFNLGYGFGDTTAATENMLFYGDQAHKLENVDFGIPGDADGKPEFMKTWKFTSDDNRVNLVFEPEIDRYSPINVGIMCMIPHQVFGLFSGICVLDDGREIKLDKVRGFAEKVHNRW